uniref:Putative GRF1-interacting factor 1-like isoform X2 n=1 Tax=Davidia involucrata TaxID=16924 RepID=A0A5B7CD33_DAVIN
MQQQLMQMQQQQQQPMMTGGFNPSNITTDHIQRYLDENKSLILKILENQNSGKLNECAENQARLQRNLMYLAAIADCQPQPPSMYAQLGANYMQHQQSQETITQARSPMLYAQQQQPYSAFQQQQSLQSQLGISSAGSSGLQTQHSNINAGRGGTGPFAITGEGASRVLSGASNQDAGSAGSAQG